MIRFLILLLVTILVPSCKYNRSGDLSPVGLKCMNLENPAGVQGTPAFSWIIESDENDVRQTAYQIVLSDDLKMLKNEDNAFWNSGKLPSSETAWIKYAGHELKSGTKYFWKIRFWDGSDKPSPWNGPSYFITGLLKEEDWKNAEWFGYEEIPDSMLLVPGVHGNGDHLGEVAKRRTVIPCFRREFRIPKKVDRALVFVCGLGQYEISLNGSKIGNRFLSPGWTNYDKTCYYNTYDITEDMNRGKNAIGVIVGNGFYNINRERYRKLVIAWGAPKMILSLKIRYTDGSEETIVSDTSWKTAPSPITFTSIYGGEDYDSRLEQQGWDKPDFDDSGWKSSSLVRRPSGKLVSETDYPLNVMQVFEPAAISERNDSVCLYDFGQNASGILKLSVTGRSGQRIRLYPGELIDDDSLVNQKATGSPYYYQYTLKGAKEEIWIPRFSYYGFRYVQANGAISSGSANPGNLPVITGLQFLHTRNSSPEAGSFRCSSSLFNRIYELINWSIRSNLASVATDCPHREKLGWLEQAHLMGNSIRYVYDVHNLYLKIIDDMMEAQLDNGLVPDIAPEYVPFTGGFRDSPEWSSACIMLPWDIYQWYGDTDAVKKAYPMMKRYLRYLEGKSENNILSHGLGDWYDLGPKFPGEAQLTPKAVSATSIFYYDAKLLSGMASIIGEDADAKEFRNLAESIRISFNDKFFDRKAMIYSTGSQTAMAMPLYFGIVDDSLRKDVISNLVKSIKANNKALTAGDIGYRYLLQVLSREGYSQLIYEMNSRTDVPGYGFQLSKGATSLTESWAGLREVSNNHMMLGHLMEWFYSSLGGIRQMPGSIGFDYILIAPDIVGDITWTDTSCRSVHGEIRSSWKISEDKLTLRIVIPPNSKATVKIPFGDPGRITENGIPLRSSAKVSYVLDEGEKVSCEVPSGDYTFVCTF